jgi:hypothetical protein
MMNHRKSNKKLLLNKESLRRLQSTELALAVGGVMNNTKSCNDACGGGGGGGGGNGGDTVATCLDSYLACYF